MKKKNTTLTSSCASCISRGEKNIYMCHKKTLFIVVVLVLSTAMTFGQNFQERYRTLVTEKDTAGQIKLLKEWRSADPKDPELFIAVFNYYINKSRDEVITIGKQPTSDNTIRLTQKENDEKTVGYMGTTSQYNAGLVRQGITNISEGITLYPTRLDMRFGKIYMLGEMGEFTTFTSQVIESIEYGNKIKNAWLWKEGKPLEDAEAFFLSSIHDYMLTIYNTNNDSLLPLMRQIAEAVLKYHPNHVVTLTDAAITCIVANDYDQALKYLLKAESVDPKDMVVLNDIAVVYKRQNDKVNAKLYFEKIVKGGTEENIANAKQQLKELE